MFGAAIGEASVVIALAVLLLIVVPLRWGLRAIGCLLLRLWPDYPSPLLLLRSSALSVGHNPEALRLRGGGGMRSFCPWRALPAI
jgi:hypothetical protein